MTNWRLQEAAMGLRNDRIGLGEVFSLLMSVRARYVLFNYTCQAQ